MIITIDGPTASGKSTAGRKLAKQLGYYYLYTGLLYRGLAFILMRDHSYALDTIAYPDIKIVDEILSPKKFVYRYDAKNYERLFFHGTNITLHLKGDVIGQAASIVSTNIHVRNRLNLLQRTIANDHDVVIDGRDSGAIVFPHADKKFFLTASEIERASRWQELQRKRGVMITVEQAVEQVQMRDERDSSRKNAPLTIPKGAHIIDNSSLSSDQTLAEIIRSLRLSME